MSASPLSLKATGRSRRRLIANRAAEVGALVAALLAIGVLGIVVWSVFSRGVHALSWDFFTTEPVLFGEAGGIAPSIVGTAILVLIATAMALPVGVLCAIYVSEFATRRRANQVRLWLDILNGFPSIVIGIFVFALLVKAALPVLGWGHEQSAWAGGFALAIIMLPLVARSTMEVLALVPDHLREASYALGTSKWRTVVSVVIPSAMGGIVTGATLAVARAAGETAPLLFTCAIAGTSLNFDPGQAMNSIPVTILTYSEAADPALHEQAWAAAFVLISFVLVTSLTARILLDRSRRKLGQVQ
jgi:phosphate transport system permease protein